MCKHSIYPISSFFISPILGVYGRKTTIYIFTFIFMELQAYFQAYLKLSYKKNLTGIEALEAVKQNGDSLQYVKEQTPEIALKAVKQNGYSLQYVKEQTPEIALEAVKQNGDSLQYVNSSFFPESELQEKIPELIEVEGRKYQLVK